MDFVMDRWRMDKWMDKWVNDGRMDGWMDDWTTRWMDGHYGWKNEQQDGWMN